MKYLFVLFAIALNGMDINIVEQFKQQVASLSAQVSLLTAYVLRLDTEVKSMQSKQLLSRSGSSEALIGFGSGFLESPRRSPKLHKGDDLGN